MLFLFNNNDNVDWTNWKGSWKLLCEALCVAIEKKRIFTAGGEKSQDTLTDRLCVAFVFYWNKCPFGP